MNESNLRLMSESYVLPIHDSRVQFKMNLRYCLREPIPEIEIAAQRLSDAVSAHLSGEREVTEELLRQANDKIIWDWLDSVWGKFSIYNRPRRMLTHPPVLRDDQRATPRYPTEETKRMIHLRDGYYCRFCKMPVIREKIRSAMKKEYPHAVPWGRTNASQHAAFQCMWAQYDHVIPHERGGCSTPENIVLTCSACNYGKFNYLLEEMDLIHPDHHPARRGDWDGLERFIRSRAFA